MIAITYDRYGGPEVLRVEDIPAPQPGPGQVLVDVVATSVNLSDWECLVGAPAYARIGGMRRPAVRTLGSDIAGRVVALGPGVTGFAPGDPVYGDNLELKGGFAEQAVVAASAIAHKPDGLSFTEAAAIPQAAAIASSGMAGVAEGDRVLINGAGGGGGSFAIQLAKLAGAHITGVDNAGKLGFMRSLGADEVIDYRAEDPTRTGPYALVLDMVGRRSVFAYRRMLAPGGRYRFVGGTTRALLRSATIGALVGRITGRTIGPLLVKLGPRSFVPVADLCGAGVLDIHIDGVFDLEHTADALRRVGDGAAHGKVVVQVRAA